MALVPPSEQPMSESRLPFAPPQLSIWGVLPRKFPGQWKVWKDRIDEECSGILAIEIRE
jgi:hypothetical protein